MCRFKNGKELKASAKYVMSIDNESATLSFKDVDLTDAGTYKCEASNKLGRVQTECKLDVQGMNRFLDKYRLLCTVLVHSD